MDEDKNGRRFRSGRAKNKPDLQFYVGRQLLGHVPFEDPLGTDVERFFFRKQEDGILNHSPQVCGGQVLMTPKKRRTFQLTREQYVKGHRLKNILRKISD